MNIETLKANWVNGDSKICSFITYGEAKEMKGHPSEITIIFDKLLKEI